MNKPFPRAAGYAMALGGCALVTGLILPLRGMLDLANAVMLYLLLVFLVALRLGRGPALLAAFVSVALIDFFLVPPHYSLAVSDAYYLITLAVMLAVGVLTAGLVSSVREESQRVLNHEQETRDLYRLACLLTGTAHLDGLREAVAQYLQNYGFSSRIYLLNQQGQLDTSSSDVLERQLLQLSLSQGQAVVSDADSPSTTPVLYLPLRAPLQTRGVMAIFPIGTQALLPESRRELFMTMASLCAIALERLHYAEVAHSHHIEISAEKLKTSLLSTLSHDLRTPLTSLIGVTDTLAQTEGVPLPAQENIRAIQEQAYVMNNMLTNLLDMARLQAGKVTLRKEWLLFEDVISASLQLQKGLLGDRKLEVQLEKDLPLVEFDAVLLERVLCNLLENAVKYSDPGSPIQIHAYAETDYACIAICDKGKGFPPQEIDRLFELFERGESESVIPGVGLGLGICRAIMQAHGGSINAENQSQGGARVILRLPRGVPPVFQEEEDV